VFVLNKLDIKIKIHFFVFYFDRYKTRGEFASDARLVFNNCMIFNEDESDVGKAGHSMRKVFETRWKEHYHVKKQCSENFTDCTYLINIFLKLPPIDRPFAYF